MLSKFPGVISAGADHLIDGEALCHNGFESLR